mmetsp:Transcript_792/g.830  ORF Transcript_792/g.830 Transcript_792/m.830 type:complete len:210 (-) Transcript_792:671-1300(-)
MKITVRKARTNGAGTNKRKTVPLKEETPKFTASEKRSKNNGRKSKRKVRKASTVKKSKTRSRKPVRKRERSTTLNAGKAGSAIESKQTKAQKEQEPEKENETVNTGSRTKLRRSQTVEEEVENKVQITSTVNLKQPCVHGRPNQGYYCAQCPGRGMCSHGKRKYRCGKCRDTSQDCEHKKVSSRCKECLCISGLIALQSKEHLIALKVR